MNEGYALVALPLPVNTGYTYRVPASLEAAVTPGARVVVPLRSREMIGIVIEGDVPAPGPKVRPREILAAPDDTPALSPALLALARWISGYYAAPLGLTLRALLPAGLWGESEVAAALIGSGEGHTGVAREVVAFLGERGGKATVRACARALKRNVWDVVRRLATDGTLSLTIVPPDTRGAREMVRELVLTEHVPNLLEREELFRRSAKQRALLEQLEAMGGVAAIASLRDQHGFSDAVIKGLTQRGLALVREAESVRDPFAGEAGEPPPTTLTPAQGEALEVIAGLAPGEAALLHGVTGSGKTLVYLEAVRRTLAEGRGALVLVPEIALTPQTVRRFRGAFGSEIAVLHSALSDGERADAWRLLRSGERRVAVGARSALFAPVQNLGLIVVDEEHEASYKNGETPRYHTRDTALVRARLEGAGVVFGTATPSLELAARRGTSVREIRLPERIGSRPLPPVERVDLRTAPLVADAAPVPWSEALDQAMLQVLARQEQALLLLNRRGFAVFLQCRVCGAVSDCPNCSVALTVHRHPEELRCHHCDHRAPVPEICPACGGSVVATRGIGTQQLEQMLAARFPGARLARMDFDTTGGKWSHARILGAVERGEVDILLGTQMIAKGLDFPRVTLVGVVDADVGLHLPDFRAGERTFQLLAQVAGRAGRGPLGGRVLVQTRSPEHHAIVAASKHDTEAFFEQELAERAAPPWPPMVTLANVIVSGADEPEVSAAAAHAADWCREMARRHQLEVSVLGPAPCPLARLRERWRWHVVLKGASGPDARDLGQLVRAAARKLPRGSGVRVVIDRDPVAML